MHPPLLVKVLEAAQVRQHLTRPELHLDYVRVPLLVLEVPNGLCQDPVDVVPQRSVFEPVRAVRAAA